MIPDNFEGIHGEEERIRVLSTNFIHHNQIYTDHLKMIYESLQAIYSFNMAFLTSDLDALCLQYLGIRLFNDSSSMQKLFYSGYYLNSFMIMRDLIETGYLLDYFTLEPNKISEWRTSSEQERKKNFKPAKIREALDKRDGFTSKKRMKVYSMYSEYASHPTMEGSKLITVDNLGKIGPFYEEKFLKAAIEDLVRFLSLFAITYLSLFRSDDEQILNIKLLYLNRLKEWNDKYSL